MQEEYLKYKSFYALAEAKEFQSYLEQLGFKAKIEHVQKNLTEFTGEIVQPEFSVWLQRSDVAAVNTTLENEIRKDTNFLAEHHLQDLNEEELKDILRKEHEWSFEDVVVAKLLLATRGFDNYSLEKLQTENAVSLHYGKEVSNIKLISITLILFGITTFFNGYFIIGIIGQGLYYKYDKIIDHQGDKHFHFTEEVRSKGSIILLLGVLYLIGMFAWIIYQLLIDNYSF